MLFKDVIGQQELQEKLISSVKENRVSHTQLFLGREGYGGLALALAFSQYVNCESKKNDDSCSVCPSCIKSQRMIHPDIHYSYPVFKLKSGSENPALSSDFLKQWREAVLENPYLSITEWLDFINAENKQGNISAAECRSIINKLSLKSFESEYKVLIMWRVEYLVKEGNILLKLLEEPPDKTLIILIAEERDQLLPTIVSRAQVLSIPPITDRELMNVAIDRFKINRDETMKIVRNTDGNYNELLHLLKHLEDDNPVLFNRWMQLIYSGNATDLVKWIEEISRLGRENQKRFFRYALEFLHECLILQQVNENNPKLLEEEKKLAKWLAQSMEPDDWASIAQWFGEAHYHIERNAHPKILFMNLSLRLENLINKKKLSLAG